MRPNKVTLRISNDNEYSIDFSHPIKARGRIRRKVKYDLVTAEKIQKGLEYLISDSLFYDDSSKDLAKENLLKDIIYKNDKNNVVDTILDIFYKVNPSYENKIEDYLNNIFSLPKEAPKVLVMGRFGTGKSHLLGKYIDINKDTNFPFTDTSRTTTYKSEYILSNPSKSFYKFLVSFHSYDYVIQQISYCIDRALDTKLDLLFKNNNSNLNFDPINDSEEDIIINSFNSDSNNAFDLRFILGSYYRT
ncbi:MAG: hypothetical protein ACRC7N_18700, partial [Clostridium sp.]